MNFNFFSNIGKAAVVGGLVSTICVNDTTAQNNRVTGPHLIVYQTKKNCRKLVPLEMNDAKTSFITYPDPKDIVVGNCEPIALHKKYWLDRRGIGKNAVFLKKTYADYAALPQVPTQEQLKNDIKYKSPLKVICDCGPRQNFKDPVREINEWIDNGTLLKNCKEIKQHQ
jgi:hypothetical protein